MYEIKPYSDKKIEIECPVCGRKFIKKTFNQKYCSVECKNIEHKKKRKRVSWKIKGRVVN